MKKWDIPSAVEMVAKEAVWLVILAVEYLAEKTAVEMAKRLAVVMVCIQVAHLDTLWVE